MLINLSKGPFGLVWVALYLYKADLSSTWTLISAQLSNVSTLLWTLKTRFDRQSEPVSMEWLVSLL